MVIYSNILNDWDQVLINGEKSTIVNLLIAAAKIKIKAATIVVNGKIANNQ